MEAKEIRTLSQLAEYINSCEDYPTDVTEVIERNDWVDEQDNNLFDICHDEDERVTFNDRSIAVVVPYDED